MPRGPRDSRSWYLDADPLDQVDYALVDFAAAHAGQEVLDLGCGLGGYSLELGRRGFAVRGLDVSTEYVERARGLGVEADVYDGAVLPLDDGAVDTVVLLEVIEHLDDPATLLAEAKRVARRNVLLSTPNSTQSFGTTPVEFSHMLDLDHRRTFTVDSLRELLDGVFGTSHVEQTAPVDARLAAAILPGVLRPPYRWLHRAGLAKPRFFTRLLARAPA
jgi:SAM-dependent methyltransferase